MKVSPEIEILPENELCCPTRFYHAGMLLRAMLAEVGAAGRQGDPLVSQMDQVQLANASLSVLDFDAGGELGAVWLVGSTSHLAAAEGQLPPPMRAMPAL